MQENKKARSAARSQETPRRAAPDGVSKIRISKSHLALAFLLYLSDAPARALRSFLPSFFFSASTEIRSCNCKLQLCDWHAAV